MATELHGVADLMKKLQEIADPKKQVSTLRSASLSAMNIARRRAEQSISVVSPGETLMHRTYRGRLVGQGFASRSVRVKTSVSRDKGRVFAMLGVVREAFYALSFFELGTARILRRPWLRPAFEESKYQVLATLTDALRKRIDKIAKKKAAAR
jgi:HK97 gp10 family phage protein